jgi:hypothetical protein
VKPVLADALPAVSLSGHYSNLAVLLVTAIIIATMKPRMISDIDILVSV